MLSLIYRFFNSNDGLAGKLQQHVGSFKPSLKNIPKPHQCLPKNVYDEVTLIEPKHRGSLGVIYVGRFEGRLVALKVIPTKTRMNMMNDLKGMSWFGMFGSIMNKNIADMVQEIEQTFEMEMDLEREYRWCMKLKKELELNEFGAKVLTPISELSSEKCFAYNYEHAKKLTNVKKEIRNNVCRRICLIFFYAMHCKNILLGDMNIGNVLYDEKHDKIVLIDYGCVNSLSTHATRNLKLLYKSFKSYDTVRKLVRKWNGPDFMAEHIYKQAQVFMSKKPVSFENVPSMLDLFKNPLVYQCSIPPEITMSVRALGQLVDVLKEMKATFTIRKELEEWMMMATC